jgi:integrase
LTWEDVNLEQGWVRLWTRKRRGGELEADYFPMVESLRTIFQRRWRYQYKESPHVFQIPGNRLRYMMDRLCRKAKVKRFGFHAIRHYVASIMVDQGKASLKQAQLALRHRRQGTTETYLHLIERGLEDVFGALENDKNFERGARGAKIT